MVLVEPLHVMNSRSSFFGLQPCVSRCPCTLVLPKRCAIVAKGANCGDGAGVSRASGEKAHSNGVSRRDLGRFGLALPLLAWAGTSDLEAEASVSKTVRLRDVENPKLQEALRAAVVGDLENAENLFSELLKEDPNSASVWSNRGSVRVSMQKYEQAAEDFTKAIALAPEAPVPFLNRAISYEAMGRFDEAIGDCKAAIVNDPDEYAAWFNLGNVDVRVGDFDNALKAYSRASFLAPGIAGYRLKQALVLFQLDRLEETRKLVQGLVRKYPNYAEAHAVLAAVLWKEGNRDQAEGQFNEATSREPRYKDIRWVRNELQWPPGIMTAMGKFLNISY
ncbi:hypothetical protein KC19_6G174800 [Ceratodon purpureus]|uniref:Tetratricopeptide repeat protein n=1 Tax=Ceratodon purpureus TaxID=3225 RepID=A0A8T0HI62_CERPU|nr:hypothetical protein KC19_6G174800 [Ceratodon purpureus]